MTITVLLSPVKKKNKKIVLVQFQRRVYTFVYTLSKMGFLRMFLFSILTGVSVLPSAYLESKSGNSDRLFLGKYPTPEKTPDPININSKKVHEVKLPPFIIHGVVNDKVKVINTGKSVEVLALQPSKTYITGGPLGDKIYSFYQKVYYWTRNSNESAATTIDKSGGCLEDVGVFFNKEHGSFENASKQENGLAEIDFRIGICPFGLSNPLFDLYAEVLKQVRKAGSAVETILVKAVLFFDFYIPPSSEYYTYPGSYDNEETSKRYYNVIVVVIPHYFYQCISEKQYKETFGSFLDSEGNPLYKQAKQFPRTMPVIKATEVYNIPVL